MEQNFQTSFIPKRPIVENREIPVHSVNIFTVISIIILFAVLITTGGLYFYKGVLTKNLEKMQNDLGLAKNRFEPSKITELQTLDKRLRASTEILSKHFAVTPIFEALSAVTMKSVRYNKFSYNISDEKNAPILVNMSGVAVGYRSVALQSDLFAKNKNFIHPVFSNLSLDASGNVLFDLEFSVDPSFVNYKQTVVAESNQ